jgi:hypothetical protein
MSLFEERGRRVDVSEDEVVDDDEKEEDSLLGVSGWVVGLS